MELTTVIALLAFYRAKVGAPVVITTAYDGAVTVSIQWNTDSMTVRKYTTLESFLNYVKSLILEDGKL